MSHDQAIESTTSGYHMLERRQVTLAIVSGALQVHEGGRAVTLGRADVRPIEWVGQGRSAPMVPLAGLIVGAPGGQWVVSTTETTVAFPGAERHASPFPHVWVSADDLARMAAACGIEVAHREPWMPPANSPTQNMMLIVGGIVAIGLIVTATMVFGPLKTRSNESCAVQRQPEKELYPRISCQDARAELDAVARGEATPRAIVLRANSIVVDARDVKGPATITCDGIEFPVVDALQAAPEPINLGGEGPHSVLVEEQTDGTLRVSQYCVCCNVVRGERKGPKP